MDLKRWVGLGFILGVAGVGALVACSSDEGATPAVTPSPTSTTEPTAGDTVTVHVSAAAGGTVEDKGGKAKLSIPAGALEKDTDITLTIAPKSGNAVAEVADFGPDGLKFLKPASLELKGDTSLVPQGKSLAVAIESGGTFTAIEGSTYAGGVAAANVEHFTKFSLVIVNGGVSLVDPSSCQDARSRFVACGGNPQGTWLFADYCPDAAQLSSLDPFKGSCAQLAMTAEVTNTQEITIDATTTTLSAGVVTKTITADFPLSCAQSDGGGPATCADAAGGKQGTTCTDKGSGQCHCVSMATEQKAAESPSAYTTSGSTWTSSGGSSGEYCVSSDQQILYYLENKDGGSGLLYVLKKK